MTESFKYYSLDNIEAVSSDSRYYVIFGERSNGKTTAVLERILRNWIDKGEQGAYLRRYQDDIKQGPGSQIFASIAGERNLVSEWTDGVWTDVTYYRNRFFLSRWDESKGKNIKQADPFCYAFALNQMERFKGGAYPNIMTICFDEFMSRDRELTGEWDYFQNVVSSLKRRRVGLKIYLLGNTVNKMSTYFSNMGIRRANKMKPGEISSFKNEEDGKTQVVVEYCTSKTNNKASASAESDSYFIFGENKSSMITDGAWEIPNYPKLPVKYNNWDVQGVFHIVYNDEKYKGDIVMKDDMLFIFVHKKTTPIKESDSELVYSLEFSPKFNHSVGLLRGPHKTELGAKIADMFKKDLVFYQDNDIGDMVRNYILTSDRMNSTNLIK